MKRKNRVCHTQDNIGFIISVFCVIFLFIYASDVREGSEKAIKICFGTVIPAVFPMLIISSFMVNSELPFFIKKLFHMPLKHIAGLGGECLTAVFAGISGGYNIGSKTALYLYEHKKISLSEAQRLTLFFTCPGLSLCINIAGTALMGSAAYGLIFYISGVTACFISAFIYNIFVKGDNTCPEMQKEKFVFSDCLVNSVETGAKSIINISAWIIFYGAYKEVFIKLTHAEKFIEIFGEITSGILYSSENFSPAFTSAVLSFGGLCVFMQLLPVIKAMKIKPAFFLIVRASNAFLSYFISRILFRIFVFCLPVFSADTQVKIFSHNISGGISLFILCIIFLGFIKKLADASIKTHKKT